MSLIHLFIYSFQANGEENPVSTYLKRERESNFEKLSPLDVTTK